MDSTIWDDLVSSARMKYEDASFSEERAYKMGIAKELETARTAVLEGSPDWH